MIYQVFLFCSDLQDPLLLQRLTESAAFEAAAESTAFPATRWLCAISSGCSSGSAPTSFRHVVS
jgi:hypothetical protein